MRELVSVIVPVYNVEKYLDVCVQSILKSTYQELEVILVDDGSSDSSGAICDEWAKKDNRVRLIHKQNGGLSDARNVGVKESLGSYITFVDSDDYISESFISDLYDSIKESQSDIAIAPMCHVKETTNDIISFDKHLCCKILNSRIAIISSLYQKDFSCNAPSKLFKKEIFEKIRFPVGRVSEDLAVCHLLLERASSITFINKFGYFYRQREKSIMHLFNPKRLDAFLWLDEMMYRYKSDEEIIKAIQCRTINIAIHLAIDIPNRDEFISEYRIIWRHIRDNRIGVIFNSHARSRERIASIISFLGERVLKKIWNSRIALKRKEN